ncbi:chemosensory receptor c [Plakobranchus ocellatus]|uniref:Chemosensory receptor c n=1 Tax=Plakobranchus ocellatus TaxID=259542 RepID=A0AAV3Y5V5_9GAST|nr:chemosensory receptor c [Plakobranchus ocellatus]
MEELSENLQRASTTEAVQAIEGSVAKSVSEGLLTFTVYVYIAHVTGCLSILASLFGMFTNIINLKTFMAMGVWADGVTLTLFSLALSDFALCVSSLCWGVSAYLFLVERRVNSEEFRSHDNQQPFYCPVDPRALGAFFVQFMSIFGISTTLITIYLAVMRCLCVLHPFRFRGAVSAGKTTFTLVIFFLLSLATRLPPLVLMDIRVQFDPRINLTRPKLWYHEDREFYKDLLRTIVDIPLPIFAEATLIVCVIIMARALRASSRFRSSVTASSATKTIGEAVTKKTKVSESDVKNTDSSVNRDSVTSASEAESKEDDGKSLPQTIYSAGNLATAMTSEPPPKAIQNAGNVEKLSPKNARIVKQLITLSLIFIVCSLPKLCRILGDALESEYWMGGRYGKFYDISSHIQFLADTINSGVNFFIYYTFNTRFRQECIFNK